MRIELSTEEREEATAYVDAVVAAAVGGDPYGRVAQQAEVQRKPGVARLVPASVKRASVRFLVYVMRHPFDHLAHPLQRQLEEEIGQARGVAHAALTRAEHTAAELRRLRGELERERRGR
jgi:hypothetical protein